MYLLLYFVEKVLSNSGVKWEKISEMTSGLWYQSLPLTGQNFDIRYTTHFAARNFKHFTIFNSKHLQTCHCLTTEIHKPPFYFVFFFYLLYNKSIYLVPYIMKKNRHPCLTWFSKISSTDNAGWTGQSR